MVHKVLLLLVTVQNRDEIELHCQEKLGLTAKQAKNVIETASGKIAEAALFNRDIEAGKSLLRYNDMYERALRVMDVKTAISAEDKRCKLLGLYEKGKIETKAEANDTEMERIRSYLEPLIEQKGLPIDEIARLISIKVTKTMSIEYALQAIRENETTIEGAERKTIAVGAGYRNDTADNESEAEGNDGE
jgi:hypothetical protein